MGELVVESGKVFEKHELSSIELQAEIDGLTVTIDELTARKMALEEVQAEASA